MIVAQKVQNAMQCKDAQLCPEGVPLLTGLARRDPDRNRNVPKRRGQLAISANDSVRIYLKRKYIRGFINTAKRRVHGAHAPIADDGDIYRTAGGAWCGTRQPGREAAGSRRQSSP